MILSLGAGLHVGAWRGRSFVPPLCLLAPAIEGTGRIGTPHRADPGIWRGDPVLAIRWLGDGVEIPGATSHDFVPGPAEDGALLGLVVTATNPWGSRKQTSENQIPVFHEPPGLAASLPDVVLELNTGEHVLDASSGFTGSSLTFGVTGEGVSIDPVTGLLTILTNSLREGVTLTVTAANSGGTAEQRFVLTVVAEAPAAPELPEAPALVAPPALTGEGRIGTEVGLEPGAWIGSPAPALACQWLAGEAEITGATGMTYTPVAADDGLPLACRITASNAAGIVEAVTEPLLVTHLPPEATGALPDLVLAAGEGPRSVEAAAAFAGEALVYAVEGAGATIDATTGRVTLAAATPLAEAPVTVTATNSGGSASMTFRVTVTAAEPELTLDIGRANAELLVAHDLDPEQTGLHIGLRITDPRHPLHPAHGGIGQVAWTGADTTGRDAVRSANKAVHASGFADARSPGYAVWALTRRSTGAPVNWADRSNEIGVQFNITATWAPEDPAATPAASANWRPWGPTLPAFTVDLPAATPPPQPQAGDWTMEQISVQTGNGVQA